MKELRETDLIDFSLRLFKEVFQGGENRLVSPLSVMLCLGMVLSGAKGETREGIVNTLAPGVDPEAFHRLLTGYVSSLPASEKAKFKFADSVWINEKIRMIRSYERKTESQYRAEIERLPFDDAAVKKINAWVKKHTDGMIDSVIESASPEAMMYLINALVFDAEWMRPYDTYSIEKACFQAASGETAEIDGMYGEESIYLQNDRYTGFVKPYADKKYAFLAMLPEKGVSLESFVAALDTETYVRALTSCENRKVDTMIPKYALDDSLTLNGALDALGMGIAFSADADFSGMAKDPLSVGEVIHKTHIEVDERGTKAGAVTAVMMKMAAIPEEKPKVFLDRPFVYAIIDTERLVPLFIGAAERI
ncbi:MAG: serpin family protein [Lachnospiraceae bacterium]|nr:serpin family protein [Lachnospiraceae bacterium]